MSYISLMPKLGTNTQWPLSISFICLYHIPNMVQQHVGLAHCYNAQLLLDRVRAKPTSAGSGPLGTGHGKQQLFFLLERVGGQRNHSLCHVCNWLKLV